MSIRLDTSRLRACVRQVAAQTHRNAPKLMKQAAKGFVREVIIRTPPASDGRTGLAAKAAGEFAIQTDVLKLASAVTVVGASKKKANLPTVADLLAAHAAARSARGRVSQRKVKDRLLMPIDDINKAIAILQAEVGFLAAGWNKAADYLGVAVPEWIKRHRNAAGIVEVIATKERFRLKVGNAVKFVGNVQNFEQRMTRAMGAVIGNLRRQANAILAKAKQDSGFR